MLSLSLQINCCYPAAEATWQLVRHMGHTFSSGRNIFLNCFWYFCDVRKQGHEEAGDGKNAWRHVAFQPHATGWLFFMFLLHFSAQFFIVMFTKRVVFHHNTQCFIWFSSNFSQTCMVFAERPHILLVYLCKKTFWGYPVFVGMYIFRKDPVFDSHPPSFNIIVE